MRAPVMAREELPAGGAWDGFDQLTLTASNSWHKVALSRAVTPASFAVLETGSQVRLLKSGLYIITALGYFNQTITANTSPGIAIYRNGNQTGAYYGDGGIPRFVYYGNPWDCAVNDRRPDGAPPHCRRLFRCSNVPEHWLHQGGVGRARASEALVMSPRYFLAIELVEAN